MIKNIKNIVIILLLILPLFSCKPAKINHRTQLQIRTIETREYDAKNIKIVIKALMNVYMDKSYMIEEAVSDLGIIYAKKKNIPQLRIKMDPVLSGLLKRKDEEEEETEASYKAIEIIYSSAHVTKFGNKYRVRVNFNIKILDQYAQVYSLERVEDLRIFNDFFKSLDKAIYLENEGI